MNTVHPIVKIIRFIIKGIGAFALFVFFSLPEAEFLEGKGFFECLLILVRCMIACAIPMVLAAMVCSAEIQEEKEMKVRIRKEK